MREHRIHERIGHHYEFTCRNYFNPFGEPKHFDEPLQFEVINLSVGGLLAKCYSVLPKDIVLQFTLYLEDIPYVVMSRIRWQEEIIDGYVYGLEFLTIPNMLHRHLHKYTHEHMI